MKSEDNGIKINFGSGYKRKEGFINVDIVPNKKVKTDIVLGKDWIYKKKKLPFKDNSVSHIEAWGVLEHLPNKEHLFFVMEEFYRICKHNAILHICVPHANSHGHYWNIDHSIQFIPDSFKCFSKGSENLIDYEQTWNCDFRIERMKFHGAPLFLQIWKIIPTKTLKTFFGAFISEIEIYMKANK